MENLDFLYYILFGILFGLISYFIAQTKTEDTGRVYLAAILGFLFPFIGILYALIIPNEKESKSKNSNNSLTKLKDLAELQEKGILTKEEFEVKKKQLLDDI
jgi:hypothetical protein